MAKDVTSATYDFRKRKAGAAKLRDIRVSHAENGGFMAEHNMMQDNGPYQEAKTHVFSRKEGAKLLAHIAQHMGLPQANEEADEAHE